MAKEIPYLDVQNLTKSFGSLVLFEDISFSIAEGQKVGLIAKNGTGKSTLLSVLSVFSVSVAAASFDEALVEEDPPQPTSAAAIVSVMAAARIVLVVFFITFPPLVLYFAEKTN